MSPQLIGPPAAQRGGLRPGSKVRPPIPKAGGGSPVPPILVRPPTGGCKADDIELTGQKCACGSVWCSNCFVRRRAPQIAERLREFDWRSTRHVILTVDPKQFKNGQEAHENVTSHKMIAQLLHNLKRTKGVLVRDWVWCLEWHRNGFPHWHLTIDVTVQGKRGMIGGDNLRQYWPIGAVRESPIKSKAHWHHFTGYFKKHGYFEKKKAHQGMLPKWAREGTKRIQRSNSMHRQKPQSKVMPPRVKPPKRGPKPPKAQRVPKTYSDIISQCGTRTNIMFWYEGRTVRQVYYIPYWEFKNLPGKYMEGQGYVTRMPMDDFFIFHKLYCSPDPPDREQYPDNKDW